MSTLKVDTITDAAGTGAPDFDNGLNGTSNLALSIGGTESARLDSTGLGIGTNAPAERLHIESGADASVRLNSTGTGGSNNTSLNFFNEGSQWGFVGLFESTDANNLIINANAGELKVRTGGSEALMIDSSQNVGIGTLTPDSTLDVTNTTNDTHTITVNGDTSLASGEWQGIIQGFANSERSIVLGIRNGTGTNEAGYVFFRAVDDAYNGLWVDSSDRLIISPTFGNIGTDTGTIVGDQSSDSRLKSNITNTSDGLAKVLSLNPIKFNYTSEPSVTRYGFSAQEAQLIIPEAVYSTGDTEDNDGNTVLSDVLAMQYVQIIPLLVNAIKELNTRITALEA